MVLRLPLRRGALVVLSTALSLSAGSLASAQTTTILAIGVDDNTQADFEQENGALADYYWEDGDYSMWGGQVWSDGREPWRTEADGEPEDGLGFPRAFTTGFQEIRIYFQLDALEADPATVFDFVAEMFLPRTEQMLPSEHDVAFFFNDDANPFAEATAISNGLIETSFARDEVGLVEGENVLILRRTGGSIPWPTEGVDAPSCCPTAAWIQFDFVNLEADVSGVACAEPICDFRASEPEIGPGDGVDLSWIVAGSATTVTIDPEPGDVSGLTMGGSGTTTVFPTENTTYTLISDGPLGMASREVTVTVRNLESFTADVTLIRPGENNSVLLQWLVDPSASVTLDDGTGPVSVDDETVVGVGSTLVSPTSTTTYTLTSTRGGDVESAEVTVIVSDFAVLWKIGDENGNQSEFEQENGQLVDYYVNDGDYFDLGGQLWVDGMEPWLTDDSLGEDGLGFPRALTTGFSEIRIYFSLDEGQVDPLSTFQFSGLTCCSRAHNGLISTHDLEFEVNGTVVHTLEGVNNTPFSMTFDAAEANVTEGPNVIIMRRTGGGVPWPTEGDGAPDAPTAAWIQFDFVELAATIPEDNPLRILDLSVDDLTSDVSLTFASKVGRTYTIYRSTNLVDWADLNDDFPAGGATGDESVFIDPEAALDEERLYYRVGENP